MEGRRERHRGRATVSPLDGMCLQPPRTHFLNFHGLLFSLFASYVPQRRTVGVREHSRLCRSWINNTTLISQDATAPKHSVHPRRKASQGWKKKRRLICFLKCFLKQKQTFFFFFWNEPLMHFTSCIKSAWQSFIKKTNLVELISWKSSEEFPLTWNRCFAPLIIPCPF